MKILLADPSLTECQSIQSLLGHWQHDLTVVRTGQSALCKLLHEAPPGLALLDALLPGMDGFSLCRWIRSHLASRPMHVVILSGANDEVTQQRAAAAGASAILGKPLAEFALKEQFALAEIGQQIHLRAMQRLSLATTQHMKAG